MNKENIISSPDEVGWYWFKKNKNDEVKVVFVNDDGEAVSMDESGNFRFEDDFVGMWEKLEGCNI